MPKYLTHEFFHEIGADADNNNYGNNAHCAYFIEYTRRRIGGSRSPDQPRAEGKEWNSVIFQGKTAAFQSTQKSSYQIKRPDTCCSSFLIS